MGYPIIDVEATGANILRLRKLSGLSVKDLQDHKLFISGSGESVCHQLIIYLH